MNVSSSVCDHKSVGAFVWNDNKLLLIERLKFPVGFAVPAGHVDENKTYEEAVIRELREEVGLIAESLELVLEGRKDNPCRRDGGDWHYWKLYKVRATGEVQRNLDETKQARWLTSEEIKDLAVRTEKYNDGKINEEAWNTNPGLESVMYEWFKHLNII